MLYLFFFSLLTILVKPANAVKIASPTPTSLPDTPVSDENIQKIRQAVQQKVKEKLASITSTTTGKKAFIGTITTINQNDITISYRDQTHQLTVDEETVFINTKRNKTTLDKIPEGQAVLAMGYLNEEQILETKRLIAVDAASLEERKHIVVGQIVDISQSSSIFVLIPSGDKDIQYQLKTDSKTETILKDKTAIKFNELENGQKVIVIFSPTQKNSKTYYAHKIIKLTAVTPTENN